MNVLALDFDGVICDSGKEVFYTALRTYVDLHPESRWRSLLGRMGGMEDAAGYDWAGSPEFKDFRELMPLGNRAEDFGVALKIMEAGVQVQDQAAYDAFYREVSGRWCRDYHRALYRTRDRLRERHEAAWFALHEMYPPIARMLARNTASARYAIVTAKDRTSVRSLLVRHGMIGLFQDRYIFDKDAGAKKTEHLKQLSERSGAPFEAITFVDDKVNHLAATAPLGVCCVLAGWGYNASREWREAEARGFSVATLDTAASVLFPR